MIKNVSLSVNTTGTRIKILKTCVLNIITVATQIYLHTSLLKIINVSHNVKIVSSTNIVKLNKNVLQKKIVKMLKHLTLMQMKIQFTIYTD